MAGDAVLLKCSFARSDTGRIARPIVDQRLVIELGHHLIERLGFCIGDHRHRLIHPLRISLRPAELVVSDPITKEENQRAEKDEKPPVRQGLIILADAVVFMLAEHDLAFFTSVLGGMDFGFFGHGGGEFNSSLKLEF